MRTLPSLTQMLSQVPDFRQQSKVRHPLPALLLHSTMAVLSGCRGATAMAEWGRLHPELARELGYVDSKTPCAATFCRLFVLLDWQAFVAVQQRAEVWMQPLEERASKAEKPSPTTRRWRWTERPIEAAVNEEA